MQRIERYGVIALVLLLVTIAAVSFWDDGTTTDAAERGGDQRQERLAQNTAETDARVQSPRRNTGKRAELPKTAPKRANQRPGSASSRPARPSSQGSAPKTQPSAGFETVEPKIAPSVVEGPEANEALRGQESNDVEFPKLGPGRGTNGRRSADEARGRYGDGPTAAELAANGANRPGSGAKPPYQPPVGNDAERPQPTPRSATYTVKAGDSLSGIASRELGTKDRLEELLALNGISNPDLIFEGQVLKLPTGAAPSRSPRVDAPSKGAATPPAGPASGLYVVQSGEVLGVIAQRELGSAKRYVEIVTLNPGLDADRIQEGMRLRMPSDWRSGSVVASAAPQRAPRSARRASTKSNKVR